MSYQRTKILAKDMSLDRARFFDASCLIVAIYTSILLLMQDILSDSIQHIFAHDITDLAVPLRSRYWAGQLTIVNYIGLNQKRSECERTNAN